MCKHTQRRIEQALEALSKTRGNVLKCDSCGEVLLSGNGEPTDVVSDINLIGDTDGSRHIKFTCKCGMVSSEVTIL